MNTRYIIMLAEGGYDLWQIILSYGICLLSLAIGLPLLLKRKKSRTSTAESLCSDCREHIKVLEKLSAGSYSKSAGKTLFALMIGLNLASERALYIYNSTFTQDFKSAAALLSEARSAVSAMSGKKEFSSEECARICGIIQNAVFLMEKAVRREEIISKYNN